MNRETGHNIFRDVPGENVIRINPESLTTRESVGENNEKPRQKIEETTEFMTVQGLIIQSLLGIAETNGEVIKEADSDVIIKWLEVPGHAILARDITLHYVLLHGTTLSAEQILEAATELLEATGGSTAVN